MEKIPFNLSWKRTSMIDGEGVMGVSTASVKTVDLPDDYVIDSKRSKEAVGGAFSGYFRGGSAIYQKKLEIPEEWEGKNILLSIDGVYQTSEVVCNTERIAFHAYGYSPYCVDLTPWLKKENTIEISTENHQPNSRWYSGGGVYRQVHLLVGGKYYLHPWSVFVETPVITKEKALVKVSFGITNSTARNASVTIKLVIKKEEKLVAEAFTAEVLAFAGKETCDHILVDVPEPVLWDLENCNLYEAKISLYEGEELIDTHSQSFGIRRLEFSVEEGMKLNGREITMKGACFHHDHGLLGAAAYPAAEERKLRIIKELGYQAIRTSHNPVSETFLDLCDRLGLLVLEEAFDTWLKPKTGNDYAIHFRDHWQEDLTAMVRRDRNHPCIFAWSVGNEIKEMEGSSLGVEIVKNLADCVHSLDLTRPVTVGQHGIIDYERAGIDVEDFDFNKLQGNYWTNPGEYNGEDVWGKQTERHFAKLDLAGYNYLSPRYEKDRVRYPHRIILATETHPFYMYEYWTKALEASNCIGDFIWTAYDNIGEAGSGRTAYDEKNNGFLGEYPWLSNSQGDCDLDGNRRPQSYYHKILWGMDKGIHLFSYDPIHYGKYSRGTGWHWNDVSRNWTFGEEYLGKAIRIEAYADCEEVEFILNGKSIGRKEPEKYIASLDTIYERGLLEAVAYQNGREIARDRLETTGEPARLVLLPEKTIIRADGLDLAFVKVEVRDGQNRLVTGQSVEIAAACPGARLWMGSGNPCTEENYGTGRRYSWQGKALLAVGAVTEGKEIELQVWAEGLKPERLTLKSLGS